MNIEHLVTQDLLGLYNAIEERLQDKGVIRTKNNPVGDYAEYLFCNTFDWKQASNSQKSIDAINTQGTTYQIKARRQSRGIDSRQLSALRDLNENSFDYLAGLVFNPDYTVYKAAIIPIKVVVNLSTYVEHTNSWKFFLKDSVWNLPEVEDVTETIKIQSSKL